MIQIKKDWTNENSTIKNLVKFSLKTLTCVNTKISGGSALTMTLLSNFRKAPLWMLQRMSEHESGLTENVDLFSIREDLNSRQSRTDRIKKKITLNLLSTL